VLEFTRVVENLTDELKEKCTLRKLLLGSCKLNDSKNEKNGAFEFAPPVRDIF
jgi:hypothetical protein